MPIEHQIQILKGNKEFEDPIKRFGQAIQILYSQKENERQMAEKS